MSCAALMDGWPVVIGGLGGSGTRAVVDYLRMAGVFPGSRLNVSNDSLPFADLYDTSVDEYLSDPYAFDKVKWCRKVGRALEEHLAGKPPGQRWLLKNPRSILMLEPLSNCLEGLFFVHVVRNGVEMAFSGNQRQAVLHGDRILGPEGERLAHGPVRSLAVWEAVNRMGERFARLQPDKYLRIRYEDFCLNPAQEMERLDRRVGFGLEHGKVDQRQFRKSLRALPVDWQHSLPAETRGARSLLQEYGYQC
jgi:hypothetical protein